MKKNKLLFFIFLFIINLNVVTADSVKFSSSLGKQISVNEPVTVTATVSADSPFVSVEGKFICSGAGVNEVINMDWDDGSNSIKSKSYNITFKATNDGVVKCNTSKLRFTKMSADGWVDLSDNSIEITVKNKINDGSTSSSNNSNGNSNSGSNSSTNKTTNKTTSRIKSSINYLSSLSIDGVELSPVFDKNTTEYEVVLENGTDKINVNGTKESSVSYVTGLGEISVSEGVNFINVVVTAENGAKRTYVVKATVLEEDPIIVNINNQDMTLVRKVEAMPLASDYYVSDTVVINDIEIPSYTSEITGYTLVALKGSDGNTSLYRYDKDTNAYLDYKELGFNVLRISLLEPDLIPEGYVVGSVNVNEQEIVAYTKEGEYPLVYGINLENGETNFYSYDSYENTIQRFFINEQSDYSEYYPFVIIGLLGLIIVQFIVMIIIVVSKNKKQRKLLLSKLDVKTEHEKKHGNSDLKSLNKKNKKKINKKGSKDDNMYRF